MKKVSVLYFLIFDCLVLSIVSCNPTIEHDHVHDKKHVFKVFSGVIESVEKTNNGFKKVNFKDNSSQMFIENDIIVEDSLINDSNRNTITYYVDNYLTKIDNRDSLIRIGFIIDSSYFKFITSGMLELAWAGTRGCINGVNINNIENLTTLEGEEREYLKMLMTLHVNNQHTKKDVFYLLNPDMKVKLNKFKTDSNRMDIGIDDNPVEIEFKTGPKLIVKNITVITHYDF